MYLPELPRETGAGEGGLGRRTHLREVPHRQFVFTIPKRLRIYFRFERRLLGELCRGAARTVTTVYRAATRRGIQRLAWFGIRLSDLRKKISLTDISISKGTTQSVPVNFVVKRKHDPSAVGVLHSNVAALPVYLDEPKPAQRRINFSSREKR
jgi:hypothetical protein